MSKLTDLINQRYTNTDIPTLDIDNWKEFSISELFYVKGTKTTSQKDLDLIGDGSIPYVTTQSTNNGVRGFYDISTEDGNVITIDSAVTGFASYQEISFSASDHVEKLIPKFEMNKYVAIFICTILNMEQFRYNYGRKRAQKRLKEEKIKLPSTSQGEIDTEFIEKFIKTLKYSKHI